MKEQIKAKIERIFDNPEAWHVVKNTYGDVAINEPILKVEWVADQILALFPQGDKNVVLAKNKYRDFINSAWEAKPSTFDRLTPEEQICMMGRADGFDDGVNAQHALDNQSNVLHKPYTGLLCNQIKVGERVMDETITMNIDKIDAGIILELLKEHKAPGEYYGIKRYHDKRVNNLIKRLEEVLDA